MITQAFRVDARATTIPGSPRFSRGERGGIAAAFAFAVLAPVAIAAGGPPVLLGLAAGAVLLVAARSPVAGVSLYLATLPFLAGIDRGTALPLVRPNEAVLALVVAGALLGAYARYLTHPHVSWRRTPIDGPLVAFALIAIVWPVTLLLLRGNRPTGADLAAILPTIKLVGIFLLTRTAVRTERQLLICTRLVIWPAGVVAVITILQTLQVGVVLSVLQTYWASATAPGALTERGTATLGSAIAAGDYLLVALALLLGCHRRHLLDPVEAGSLGVLCAAGLLATGQFSTWIGAVVMAIVLRRHIGVRRRQLLPLLPVLALAVLAGLPAVLGRLAQFGNGGQASWAVRWANLSTFYLPQLTGSRLLFGVEPNSVLSAPETWRTTVYLESGYLGLLWLGGIPLLMAFGWLSWAVFRHVRALTDRPDVVGAHADALRAAWWLVVVLSVLDPHLFLRGTGDLLAVLLAVSSGTLAGPSVAVEPRSAPAVDRPRSDPYPASHALIMRTVDVVLAGAALLLLAPALLTVAHLVRAGSRGTAIFRQERLGLGRRPFLMLKFRTMRPGSSDTTHREMIMAEIRGEDTSNEGSWKLVDPRVTPLGHALRRTSIDELPQLLNVLEGRMSLVGPRPCLQWEADMFPPEAAVRFTVKPGLTGLWQVSGRSTMGTLDMLRLDVEYVRTRTLRGDLSILLRTVPSMLRGGGAR